MMEWFLVPGRTMTDLAAYCEELGQKSFDVATVMGLQAPAGTPPKLVARLQAEVASAMREPAMAARMKQLGMVMEENGTASYQKFMSDDLERYAVAVRKLNLQPTRPLGAP